MHYSFINTPIALTAAATLTVVSLLSSATGEEFDGRSAAREPGQRTWYRSPEDHLAGQKSAEPTRSDHAASGTRWINVADIDSSQTAASGNVAIDAVTHKDRSQESVSAIPTPVPRELTPANPQPLALQSTSPSAARDVRGQIMWTLLAKGRRPAEELNKRLVSTEGENAGRLRVPEHPTLNSVDAKTEPPAAEQLAPLKRKDLLSQHSLGAAVTPRPQEASLDVSSIEKSSPRELAEFGLPSSEPQREVEATPVAPPQVTSQLAKGVLGTGPKPTPTQSDLPSQKQPHFEVPPRLSLTTSHRDEPRAVDDAQPIRSSQPAAMRDTCIQLDAATLHHLRLHDPIDRIEVGDERVCEALRQTDRDLDLIAKQNGETSVTIHYTTDRTPEVYTVRVGTLTKPPSELASDLPLQTLIAEMFPGSNVQLKGTQNKLVVTGTSRSDAEAVRLISFVRSLRLVPVMDQIKVQR